MREIVHAPALLEFLAMTPTLTAWGWMNVDDPRYKAARRRLLDAGHEWVTCVLYIAKFGVPRHVRTTYELKHLAEREFVMGHVCQGAMMAAVLMCGYSVEREGTGLRFNDYRRKVREISEGDG